MEFINSFKEITGKTMPPRIQQFFLTGEFKKLTGKNIAPYFEELFEDNGIDYDAIVLEADFEKMEMLSEWSNDGYYDEESIYIPLTTVKDETSSYIGAKVDEPEGSIYFFDKDSGFLELELTLDELIKKTGA